jgi:hypothetical protein
MAFPFTRDELVDWFMEFKQATYPFDPVTREQVDSIVEGIKDDGKVIFTSPGKINIIGEALFVKIGISVLAGLIAKAIIWGGGQVLEGLKLPPPEVADKLGGMPTIRAARSS